MTVRKSGSSIGDVSSRDMKRNRLRRSLVETLERRELLTTGPMLAGIHRPLQSPYGQTTYEPSDWLTIRQYMG